MKRDRLWFKREMQSLLLGLMLCMAGADHGGAGWAAVFVGGLLIAGAFISETDP